MQWVIGPVIGKPTEPERFELGADMDGNVEDSCHQGALVSCRSGCGPVGVAFCVPYHLGEVSTV